MRGLIDKTDGPDMVAAVLRTRSATWSIAIRPGRTACRRLGRSARPVFDFTGGAPWPFSPTACSTRAARRPDHSRPLCPCHAARRGSSSWRPRRHVRAVPRHGRRYLGPAGAFHVPPRLGTHRRARRPRRPARAPRSTRPAGRLCAESVGTRTTRGSAPASAATVCATDAGRPALTGRLACFTLRQLISPREAFTGATCSWREGRKPLMKLLVPVRRVIDWREVRMKRTGRG